MSKVSGIPPKIVEPQVSELAEAQGLLWDAVPRRRGENLKAWYVRAASDLGWNARRVRAYWNGEVRTVRHREIKTLNQRIDSAKAATQAAREHSNAIKESLGATVARGSLDGRAPHGVRGDVEPSRRVVSGSDQ